MAAKHPDLDFIGTGRSFTEEETTRVSAWIKEQKAKAAQKVVRPKERQAKTRAKAGQ